jgi:uncharacterized protein (DUF983 family)
MNPSPTPEPRSSSWSSRLASFWAMVRMRCPRCRQGRMFRSTFEMNDPCPECGLLFEREEGYFLGAMYVSYGLGSAIVVPLFYLVQWLLPDAQPVWLFAVTVALYLPLVPLVFRYSRVIWTHFDRLVCPTSISASTREQLHQARMQRTQRSERHLSEPNRQRAR